MQGAGFTHAPRDFGFELTLGNVGNPRDFFYGLGHDFCGAFSAIRCPVLIAAKVKVVGAVTLGIRLIGQRRQVGHVITHFGEAPEHALVVLQGAVVVERIAFGRHQLVAIDQPTGGLIHHHQFHTTAFERIVQLLHALVACGRGVKFGAQVFLGSKQPVTFGLHQRGEVLLIARGVVFGIVGFGAQVAARLGAERGRLNIIGLHTRAGSEDGGGQARKAQ